MTRLIDADALLEKIKDWIEYCSGHTDIVHGIMHDVYESVVDDIKDAPTIDAVPVVRCKDCVLRGDDKCPMMWWEEIVTDDDGWSEYNYTPHDRTTDDGFCHMGRRANDERSDQV